MFLSLSVAAVCEPWCTEPCTALNGDNLQAECGDCSQEWACNPGAVGFTKRPNKQPAEQADRSAHTEVNSDEQRVYRAWLAVYHRWQQAYPLHHAAAVGNDERVAALLREGASPMAADAAGWSALRHALMSAEPRPQGQRVVQLLVNELSRMSAADAVRVLEEAPRGLTLLEAAAGTGNVYAVAGLLDMARRHRHTLHVTLALAAARSRGAPDDLVALLEACAAEGLACEREAGTGSAARSEAAARPLQSGEAAARSDESGAAAACAGRSVGGWEQPTVVDLSAEELIADEEGWRGRTCGNEGSHSACAPFSL
jgi:hypothetical protein